MDESGTRKVGREKCGEKNRVRKVGARKVELRKVGRGKWDEKSGARKVGREK